MLKLKSNNPLLIVSLGCNLIFLIAVIAFINYKGGINYIQQKLFPAASTQSKSSKQNRRVSYYTSRRLMFETLPNTSGEIVFLGDSLTDQGEWTELLNNAQIRNRGISGDTTDSILNRLDEVIESQPDKIFIMIGVNDIWQSQQSIEHLINNYEKILSEIKTNTPNTQVYIQSLLPVNNQEFTVNVNNRDIIAANNQLVELAQQFDYTYINLFDHFVEPNQEQLNSIYTSDGVHLTGVAYLKWREIVQPYL